MRQLILFWEGIVENETINNVVCACVRVCVNFVCVYQKLFMK